MVIFTQMTIKEANSVKFLEILLIHIARGFIFFKNTTERNTGKWLSFTASVSIVNIRPFGSAEMSGRVKAGHS